MNLITLLENSLSREGFISGLKSMANYCNSQLMTISRMRLNNIAKHGDADYVTMDDKAGEAGDEHAQNEMAENTGKAFQLPLTKRGDIFASIRRACIEAIDGMSGLTEFDKPQEFPAYMESRITGLRSRAPTPENIQTMMNVLRGMTEDEVKFHLTQSYALQAGQLEEGKLEIIAEDGSYDDTIDFEEAIGSLRKMDQYRLRIKITDGLLYEVDRLMKSIMRFPTYTDLITKREVLLGDADIAEQELNDFEKANKSQLRTELEESNQELNSITRDHQNRLTLYRRQKQKAA